MAKPVILRFLADTTQFTASLSKVKGETAALSGPFGAASASMRAFGATAMKTGAMLTRRLTLPIVAIAAVSAKLATDFEDSMSKIEGLVGVSSGQVKKWGDDILALSRKLPQSPRELADALFFVTSAGFRGKEAMQVLEASARAAAAGLGETRVVADAVTSAVNAYGISNLSAKAATDVLVASVREGKMPAEDLAGALGRVIAPAQALGVGFDQVGASIASMTRLGLSADESATALRAVLMGVLKPSQQATEAFASMGYSGDQLRKVIAEKGLLAGLQDLRAKAGDNTAALGKLFPNVRALNGFLIMTGASAGATKQIFDNLAKSTGSSDKAFRVAAKTAKFQFHSALSSLQATGIQIGAIVLPVLVSLAHKVAGIADAFSKVSPRVQKFVVIGALLVAAIGPLVWIIGAISTAIGFLLSPVGLVIVAIAALAFGIVMLWKKSETFREIVKKVGERIREFAGDVREAFQRAVEWVRSHSDQIHGRIRQLGKTFSGLVDTIRAAWDAIFAIGAFLVKVVEYVIVKPILDLWTRFGDQLLDHLRIAWNAILETLGGVLQFFRGIFEIFAGIFTLNWSKVWTGVKDVFGGIWNVIVGLAKMGVNLVSTVIGGGIALISEAWGYVWGGLKGIVSAAWDGILWAAKHGWNLFAGFWNRVLDALMMPAKIFGDHVPGMKWLSSLASVRIPTFDLGGGSSGAPSTTPVVHSGNVGFFANGGVIDRPTLAMIGEAGSEAVIPMNRPRRAAQIMQEAGLAPTGTDGRGITIQTMTVTALDPRRAARIAAEEWAWAAKTGGY